MFFGIIILIVMIQSSLYSSSNLPDNAAKDVWVYRNDTGAGSLSVCRGNLHAGGLRGSVLGWTDGLLQGWGSVYTG